MNEQIPTSELFKFDDIPQYEDVVFQLANPRWPEEQAARFIFHKGGLLFFCADDTTKFEAAMNWWKDRKFIVSVIAKPIYIPIRLVTLNSDYSAKVYNDCIRVGCSKFDINIIDKLRKAHEEIIKFECESSQA